MQGLHHRHAFFAAGVIDRRRNDREKIVDVHHIRPAVAQKGFEFLMPGARPDTVDGRFDLAHQAAGVGGLLFDFFDLKSVLLEQLRFRFKDLIFASRLDVVVMHAQNAETRRLVGNRKSKRGHNGDEGKSAEEERRSA